VALMVEMDRYRQEVRFRQLLSKAVALWHLKSHHVHDVVSYVLANVAKPHVFRQARLRLVLWLPA
jgi:hypothetical protein